MRLAWFSPLPPTISGIAVYSAELLPKLEALGIAVDCFVETNAHDFVWTARKRPYDLVVYQLGNALCHHYMWAYMFRHPGLVALHDAQLHQARALALTKRWLPRRADYLDEFRANHPDAPAAIGELIAAGLGGSLYAHWPHIRLVLESARMIVVHNQRLGEDLRQRHPHARIEAIAMGVADPLARSHTHPGPSDGPSTVSAVANVRRRHRIGDDDVVLAAFGGVTPEKRIGALFQALRVLGDRCPQLRIMLVGGAAGHYDAIVEARRSGVADRVAMTGFVRDEDLPAYLLAADICACLRWPTNRETSASWLRCLAAGRATLITDLADLADVPTLDPRRWHVSDSVRERRAPVAVSIDIVDEDRSLELALERLVADAALRTRLGSAARAWWETHHQLDAMAHAYQRVLTAAAAAPIPQIALPAHLTDDGSGRAREVAEALGVTDRLADLWRERR